jgi:signal transduction histidine kinase
VDPWALLGAALVGVWVGAVAALTRFPKTRLSWPLRGFAACAALWAFGDLIGGLAQDATWKQVGVAIHYSGAIFLPALWWILALRWAEERGDPPRGGLWQRLPLLFAGAMWLSMLANPWHGLFLTPQPGWRNVYGPLWWATALPSYALIVGLLVLELRAWRRTRERGVRRQAAFMVAASGFTLAANWVYVAGFEIGVPATLPVLGLSAGILAVGMLREGLFGVLPAALSVIASNDPDGLVVFRPDGRPVYANRRARALLAPLSLDSGTPLPDVLTRAVSGSAGTLYRAGERGGDERWLRVSAQAVRGSRGRLLAYCLRLHDATAEQRTQAERSRARRLESVVELARGVAHDFNNLLQVIGANAQLLADDLPPRPDLQRKLARIQRSGQQARDLAQQLQLYAGAAEPARTALDLSLLARDVLEALDAERPGPGLGSPIQLALDLADDPIVLEADPTQLRQLVMNLVVNARDALGEAGGEIRLSTFRARIDPLHAEHLVLGGERPAGVYASLRVADNGSGIDPEVQERIFEPFFSTKGKQRGLGLAIVFGVARAHGALLQLETHPGRGTSFTVSLPLAEGRD